MEFETIFLFICSGKQAEFTCALAECPEHLGNRIPPNCVGQYSHDKCCSEKQVCDAEKEALHKCTYRGKTYYKNQQFWHSDEPCYSCICDENFNGDTKLQYNPKNCRKTNCNIELHNLRDLKAGCVPVYSEKSCCPLSWRCRKYP